jgi:hypothetical protein
MAPVYLSLWRSIGSNAMGKIGTLARAQLTKGSQAGMGSGDGGKPQVHRRHFSALGCSRTYPTTAAHRRRELGSGN